MALKRLSSDWEDGDGSEVPRQESKRRLGFACGVSGALKGPSTQEFVIKLEPFFKNLVREELKRKILLFSHPSTRSSLNQLEPSHARNLQLHFLDKLPSILFTDSKIESETNEPVKIVIVDAFSKYIVTSLPLPSIKVQIVVLDGDFGPEDQEDWTEEEFNTKVVRERGGKRPLVTGELVVTLRGGVGYVGNVSFTDNSSWIRSRKFRLGARTVSSISTELRIREAKSNAFVVKDHYGLYRKHHPPNLSDEIWRLEKIAKDGKFHQTLASRGINTVKDFLRFYHVDPSSLRNMLGVGVLNKTWETIVEHATACVLDNQFYMYSRDAERFGIVLNSVYKVEGAVFDGQIYEPLDKLDVLQKGLVENLKRHAYKNLGDLVPIDEPPDWTWNGTSKILFFSHPSQRSSLNQLVPSHARNLQLHFVDKLPSTLFTGSKIESETNKPVKIVIIDAFSKKLVTFLPLPSIKVQIVVLDGDFGPDDHEDWTEEEFNTKVVCERGGKRPLVTGELVVTLRGGVGYVGDVGFTDNSSWIRSQMFRLGARTVPSISTELRIREAKSNAFVVKDHRGELYRKHHPPNLSDEIWRLEKIGKDGKFHQTLARRGINTVKDFLRFYHVDPSSLRNMVGGGVSNKTWETIVGHATACVLDNQFYMFSRDAERFGIVLNSVYKVVGAVLDGQIYEPLDKLDVLQKRLVENLKGHAYKNLGDWVPIDEPPVFEPGMVPASLQPVNFPRVHQDHVEPYLYDDPMQLFTATSTHNLISIDSYPVSFGGVNTATSTHNLMSIDSYSAPYGGGNSWAPGEENGLLFSPSNEVVEFLSSDFGFDISRNGKPKSRWVMIRAVMKLVISVRRDAAANRRLAFSSPIDEEDEFLSSDFGFDVSRNGKPKSRWVMIRAVMKLVISVRRDAAANRWLALFSPIDEENEFLSPIGEEDEFLSSDFGFDISWNGKPKSRWVMIRAVMKLVISVRRDAAANRRLAFFSPIDE